MILVLFLLYLGLSNAFHTRISLRNRPSLRLFTNSEPTLSRGEDLEPFSLQTQSSDKWKEFAVAVGGVLGSLAYVWGVPGGPELGNKFVAAVESAAGGDSTVAIVYMLGIFAVVHSGLASLRPKGEEIVGAKAWRYIFAYPSLALAFTSIVYFINHRYDGTQLWDIRLVPGVHDAVWLTSLISFFFLYPSTFNLLEIAVSPFHSSFTCLTDDGTVL